VVVVRSLKKRAAVVFRQIPIPDDVAARIASVHLFEQQGADQPLWTLSRSRAWQLVKEVFARASVPHGPHCTPKGLRHGFGIHALRSGVPVNLVQRWLGHASLETTMIYLDVLGREEREMAQRMWMK
jgi:site-specific recombinase XerD